jgi:hypothetical protein
MEHIKGLCVFADQVHAQLARLTAALDSAGGPVDAGYGSTAAFLRGACGRTPGNAAELTALGRGLARLPMASKALDAGEVSADAALIITRATATIDNAAVAEQAEQVLVGAAAGGATTSSLRRSAWTWASRISRCFPGRCPASRTWTGS